MVIGIYTLLNVMRELLMVIRSGDQYLLEDIELLIEDIILFCIVTLKNIEAAYVSSKNVRIRVVLESLYTC